MANKLQLWVSPETGKLINNPNSAISAQRQVFYAGDTLELEVHLVQGVGVARVPYEVDFPAGSTVKVSVGTVATSPTGGGWKLSVSSTETAELAFDATPAAVQTALNAIGAVASAGGVTVISLGGGYSITWNTVGTKPAILSGSDTLVPSSYESIFVLQAGDATTQEIIFVELRQSPLALADSFASIGVPVVSDSIVSAWNGTNKVVRIAISPVPKGGTYVIDVDGDSAAIDAFSSASAILSQLLTVGITAVSSVSQSDQLTVDLVLTEDLPVTVDGSGLIESPALVGTISLATSELIAFLGSEAFKEATIEVSVTAAGQTRTMVQVPCTVANGVLSSGAVAPVPAGTILTESVANARFIRRDAAQSPSGTDLDVIWPNLGVSLDGSDVAAAISGAASPASGNVFATMADVGVNPFDQSLNTTDNVEFASIVIDDGTNKSGFYSEGIAINDTDVLTSSSLNLFNGTGSFYINVAPGSSIIQFADSTVQSTAYPGFDQSLNTTDSVTFAGLNIPDGGTGGFTFVVGAINSLDITDGTNTVSLRSTDIVFADSTTQSTAFIPADYLTVSAASSTYAPLADFDQGVKTTDSVTFAGVLVTDGLTAGVDIDELGITFPDATTQESAPVHSAGTVVTGGGGSSITGGSYPDEITIVIGGVTYAMPARAI
jgi:hypothetical protein